MPCCGPRPKVSSKDGAKKELTLAFPALPLDLIRLIFEIAADHDSRTALNLMLASKLTCNWIKPVMYSTLLINLENFTPTYQARSFFFANPQFAGLMRSLCVRSTLHNEVIVDQSTLDYVGLFPNLTTLATRFASCLPRIITTNSSLKFILVENTFTNFPTDKLPASFKPTHLALRNIYYTKMDKLYSWLIGPFFNTFTHLFIHGAYGPDDGKGGDRASTVERFATPIVKALQPQVQICILHTHPVHTLTIESNPLRLFTGQVDQRLMFSSFSRWTISGGDNWTRFIIEVVGGKDGLNIAAFDGVKGTIWGQAEILQRERRAWLNCHSSRAPINTSVASTPV
ncbi:hypothetical protein DL96DRAFT_372133 [Flagelloscypha sp. PMI_526]|nr:hypothetical protein DL96DRAFT_372133 [Flagelloscypha sp. PMI_526]